MENVTLEKVDMVRERTGVGYEKAKEALEATEGDVLEALIYIEKNQEMNEKNEYCAYDGDNKNPISIDELKVFFKELIEKGNVTRIKIKKDDTELVDVPVNAGIAAGVVAIVMPPVLAGLLIAAVATKITIEITKEDGSVEVINQYVSKVASDVKNKVNDLADKVKNKVKEVRNETQDSNGDFNQKIHTGGEAVYSYTVKFDEEDEK